MSTDRAGTGLVVRAIVRRDRVRISVWVVAIVVMVAISVASVKGLFPTQHALDVAAAASDNPAIIAFNGPAQALDTLGGQVAFQIGAPGLLMVALMSLLMTGRLTSGEEEAGRLELMRALPIGRHAPVLAAVIVVGAMNLAIGVLVALTLAGQGLALAGSVSFGLACAMLGWVFVAVTMVCAQVAVSARLAGGIAGVVLGVSYVIRAIGDMGNGALSWLSPIGWVQKGRPFAGEQWWPFLAPLASVVALALVARTMLDRRDLGGGLIAPRRGPVAAAPHLRSPLALAVRLQRGSVLGWALGVAATGVAYGAITTSIDQFVQDNPTMAEMFTAGGGSLVDSYLATSVRVLALMGAGFAVQSMLRLRGEESSGRAEPVMATAVSRGRWTFAHTAVAGIGSVVVQLAGALALGVSAAIVVGDGSLVGRVVGASLAYLPAMGVVIGVALALTGLAPKASAASWAVPIVTFVIAFLGPVLDLPQVVSDLSPFQHVPLMPATGLAWLPIVLLLAVAVALVSAGTVGMLRRDLD